MKVEEFVPALAPFTFHWYAGADPPFVGVAVKVTDDPGQKGLEDAVILTPAGKLLLIVINSVLLVTGFVIGHATLEVNIQDTKSPFTGL